MSKLRKAVVALGDSKFRIGRSSKDQRIMILDACELGEHTHLRLTVISQINTVSDKMVFEEKDIRSWKQDWTEVKIKKEYLRSRTFRSEEDHKNFLKGLREDQENGKVRRIWNPMAGSTKNVFFQISGKYHNYGTKKLQAALVEMFNHLDPKTNTEVYYKPQVGFKKLLENPNQSQLIDIGNSGIDLHIMGDNNPIEVTHPDCCSYFGKLNPRRLRVAKSFSDKLKGVNERIRAESMTQILLSV